MKFGFATSFVKQHGGTIEVETSPNEFTEFILALPRHSVE